MREDSRAFFSEGSYRLAGVLLRKAEALEQDGLPALEQDGSASEEGSSGDDRGSAGGSSMGSTGDHGVSCMRVVLEHGVLPSPIASLSVSCLPYPSCVRWKTSDTCVGTGSSTMDRSAELLRILMAA
jgi:hypothetical protein